MASIFNALNIGYSGLNVSQIGINTTGHNIANAETEGYTRQRVVTQSGVPLSVSPGQRGNGVVLGEIERVFDNFVFERYTTASQNKEYSDQMRRTMEELSTYFPDIDGVGIKSDLYAYFDLWQSLADNPDNTAVKIALAQQAQTLTSHINQTVDQVQTLQSSIDDQLKIAVEEVNRIAADIAAINKEIEVAESANDDNANDLRDQRNVLEKALKELIGAEVFEGQIESNQVVDSNIAIPRGSYTIHVAGFNIVDGATHHPISVDATQNPYNLNDIYYRRQDGTKIPMAESITGGKIGAYLELRGSSINTETGVPDDGVLQETIDGLNALAKGLIEATNNLYAQTPKAQMLSNEIDLGGTLPLADSGLGITPGTFEIVVFDAEGNAVATREIVINGSTTLETPFNNLPDGTGNSIKDQIEAAKDDNDDGNGTNDVDDFLQFTYSSNKVQFSLQAGLEAQGYRFSVVDSTEDGTNFAGSIGLNRFFDGEDASDIDLNFTLKNDPAQISASNRNVAGNAEVALDMVQLQFERVGFVNGTVSSSSTIYDFYDAIVSDVGTKTNSVISHNDAVTAQYNAVELEYQSISKVSIDEELTNLIKYQTAYGAAAKVISTIDEMMDTLLGIKR